uniref:Uncharacterized protein n=1 Tax=Oryza sativa subsp. japonica TaxID=39947 RepID=Q6H821_ORYSJ|nr:unknown protein [Oryza sativa Japonica Group]
MFLYAHHCFTFLTEQVLDRQADQLRSVSQKYDNANKLWAAAISNLENKIKVMKQEQTMLSLEAHGHANAVPELSKMVGAVQALGSGLQGAFVPFNSTNMGCSHGLPVLARASAGTAGLAAARGAGAVGRAQLSLLPRDDHDCCSHSGAHALQGSECELTTWSATKQVCLGIARLARSVSLVWRSVTWCTSSSDLPPQLRHVQIQRTVRHRCECQTGSPCDHPPASSTSSLKATLCRQTSFAENFSKGAVEE